MNVWQKRAAQTALELNGAVVELPEYPGWKFRVRRMCDWNMDHQRAIVRVSQRPNVAEYLARSREEGYVQTEADKDIDRSMVRAAFAEGCIVGWEGVTGPDNAPFVYNAFNATYLLGHFPDIEAALMVASRNAALFTPPSPAKKEAIAAGN